MQTFRSCFCLFLLAYLFTNCANSPVSPSPGAGTGGSTARFTISGNTLYIVGNTSLQSYDISNTSNPIKKTKTDLGFGVETIFPYQNNLFIGTQTGMYIFDITQPNTPKQLSFYAHVVSCDPVVVKGNYAYVTLRSGTNCRAQTTNTLNVIDVSNLTKPTLIGDYPMTSPYGLGIDSSLLFVTEGNYGLRIMDISNPMNVDEIEYFYQDRAYDVIPSNKLLIATGPDGIYQYSYQDPHHIKLLSQIPVQP